MAESTAEPTTSVEEDLAEFEFIPLAPIEEIAAQDQVLLIGMSVCFR